MGAGTVGSYEVESDGWTLQVTATASGNTILWLTGYGQAHELIYPTLTPFEIYAEGYTPRIGATKENEPSVIWDQAKHERAFVWMTSVGVGAWAQSNLW